MLKRSDTPSADGDGAGGADAESRGSAVSADGGDRGAGPSGCEMAGAVSELMRWALNNAFKQLDPQNADRAGGSRRQSVSDAGESPKHP